MTATVSSRRRQSGPARSDGAKARLAASVANRIVGDVINSGWPVGEVMGSETELVERYGVSRAVFREAVRLVEHQQVARMRRGPGGGLVITEPTVSTIIDAAMLYLQRVDARLDEVFEARLALEDLVTQLAPARLSESDLTSLRELIKAEADGSSQDHRALHSLLAKATGNPALELFVDILNRVTLLYFSDAGSLTSRTLRETAHAHERIAAAVTAGDASLACYRMRRHLEAEAAFLRRRHSTRQVLDPATAITGMTGAKRAEEVARELFRGVVSGRLPSGALIGSEPELMERFGVSRAIVREAVRLLEHNGVASMRRGPAGGLYVTVPDMGAVTDVVALYLERHGITAGQVFELRVGVELSLLDLVIERMDVDRQRLLQSALTQQLEAPNDAFSDAAHDFHAVIAGASGNRVLELLTVVLVRLSRQHEAGVISNRNRERLGAEVAKTHGAIAEALMSRDRALARHRMQRHLEVLPSFFR